MSYFPCFATNPCDSHGLPLFGQFRLELYNSVRSDIQSAEAHHGGLQESACSGGEIGICTACTLGKNSKWRHFIEFVTSDPQIVGPLGISRTRGRYSQDGIAHGRAIGRHTRFVVVQVFF